MNIRFTEYKTSDINRLFRAQQERANPVGPLNLSAYSWDNAQPQPFDTYSNLVVYFVNTWCYACIRAIAEWIAEVPLCVQKRQRVDGKIEWVEQTEGKLFDLTQQPNPDNAWQELSNDWVTSLFAAGDGYILYTPEEGGELWHCQSDWVKVKTNKFGQITGYHIANRGQSFDLEKAQVIHARLANPTNAFYGVPPTKVVRQTILTQLYLGNYLNKYFLNNALPGTTFSTDQRLEDSDKDRIRREIAKLHAGHDNAFRTAVLDQGTKLDRLAHNIKDLMPVELYQMLREEVLAAFSVPHIMVSNLDDASYSNADIQRKVFVENRGLPTLHLLESVLNLKLAPLFGSDLRLWYNRSAIPALQEDENAKAIRLGVLYHDKIGITLNELRKGLSLPPDPDGDKYFTGPEQSPFGQLSIEVKGAGNVPATDSRISRIDNGLAFMEESVGKWYDSPPLLKRRFDHYQKVMALETTFRRILHQFFNGQLNRVVDKLDKVTNTGQVMSRLYWYTREGEIILPNVDALFDFAIENETLAGAFAGIITRLIRNNGQGAVQEIKTGLIFDMDSPYIQSMIEQFKNRLVGINQTTYDSIKVILKQAYDEGVGIEVLSNRLTEAFEQFSKGRSETIARTEIGGMVNGASQEGYRQAGVEYKQWLPAYLPTSRQTHIDAGGLEPIPIDHQFPVGGAMLDHPGDPAGPPEETINCYCTLVPVMKEELNYISNNGHRNRLTTIHNKGERNHVEINR